MFEYLFNLILGGSFFILVMYIIKSIKQDEKKNR